MNLVPLKTNRAQIILLFYTPGPADHWLNKLVAYWKPPFSHVEIAFPERYGDAPWDKEIYGSSVYQKECVFFKRKTYARDGYESICFEVAQWQYDAIKQFCRTCAEMGVPFNRLAMYTSFLPTQLYSDYYGTFCSKYIVDALQQGRIDWVSGVNPNLLSPSCIYSLYVNSRKNGTNRGGAPILHLIPSHVHRKKEEWVGNLSSSLLLQSKAAEGEKSRKREAAVVDRSQPLQLMPSDMKEMCMAELSRRDGILFQSKSVMDVLQQAGAKNQPPQQQVVAVVGGGGGFT